MNSSFVHADANTPAEPLGAFVARFPNNGGLPRFDFGSASAMEVSRRAQRSLTFRPVRSLSRPRRPFYLEVLQSMSLPPRTAPSATGRSDRSRVGFAPTEIHRLITAHVKEQSSNPVDPFRIFDFAPNSLGDRVRQSRWSRTTHTFPRTQARLDDFRLTGLRHARFNQPQNRRSTRPKNSCLYAESGSTR